MVQGASGERVPHPRLPEEDRVVVSRVKTRDKDLLLRISPPLTRILHLETQSSPADLGILTPRNLVECRERFLRGGRSTLLRY
jgi:hypothetical protein